MKKFPLLLIASLAGNILLAALVFVSSAGGSFPWSNSHRGDISPGNSEKSAAAVAGDPNSKDVDPALWSGLSGGDLPSLVTRLREAGFPPSLVRAIVSAQINESFAARRKALSPSKTDTPYWRADQTSDPKTMAALRELNREQTKLMKELLGSSVPDDPMYAAMLRRQYGDLPREKADQLMKVRQDYDELRNEIYTAAGLGSGGAFTLNASDRAKIAVLEKEQRADFAQMLTPKELEDYELRTSNTANSMRFQLAAFNPNEEEFRTIFSLQRAFDDQYRTQLGEGPLTPDAMRQRTEAQKQLVQQIKGALGPERGADYERASDYNFQQVSRVVDRLELPKDAAVQVWTTQKDIEQRANALRSDRTLSPTARNEQMAVLAQEATAKVTSALGQRGFDVYKQYGGFWIQGLQPPAGRPAQPAAATPVIGNGEVILRR